MQVLVEETERGDVRIGKLAEFLLHVVVHDGQPLGLAGLEVTDHALSDRVSHGRQVVVVRPFQQWRVQDVMLPELVRI